MYEAIGTIKAVESKTTGMYIGLYKVAGSLYNYVVTANGIRVKECKDRHEAEVKYNELAS